MTTAATAPLGVEVKPLTKGEQNVLDYVKAHEGHSTRMIAERVKIPSTCVGTYLCRLFKEGLITKQADESDGRVVRYFPAREHHVPPTVTFAPDHQMPEVYAPGSETLPAAKPDPETKAFNALTSGLHEERAYSTLGDAMKAATLLLDAEVQKPEDYDLVLTFHLGGVISHLSKILQRR